MKKIIVAVTGASGAIYARKTVEALLEYSEALEIALIVSSNGRAVMEYEGEKIPSEDPRVIVYDNEDMFAAPASGSADYDAMVVVPCSMGSMGRIASGVSEGLIGRAADVMLKERRRLILVPRETPYSSVHLRNMTVLAEAGAVILPASPSFYALPTDMESLCDSVVERIIKFLGIKGVGYMWGGG